MAKDRIKGHQGFASGNPFASMKAPPLTKRGDPGWKENVAFVTSMWEHLKDTKRGHEKKWREILLFIADEHWLEWDDATSSYQNAIVQDWVPRPQTNYIAKTFDRLIDIFTSQDLTAKGRPFSDDQDDIDAAARSTEILAYENSEVRLDTKETHASGAGFLIATGNVILKALLDPGAATERRPVFEVQDGGPVEITNPDGSVTAVTNMDGSILRQLRKAEKRNEQTGEIEMEDVEVGKVWEKAISPLNWYPELVDNPDAVTYGIEVEVLTIAQAINMFGKEATEGLVAEDISVYGFGNFLSSKLQPLYEKNETEYVLLKTFRAEPSFDYFPEGRTVMVIGDKAVHVGPLEEYLEGKLPYRHVRYRVLPGEFWGLSPMQPAIPLQKRLNAIDSAIVANRKQNINPQWIEPKGADIGQIDGRMGARVIWDWRKSGGHAPMPKPSVGLDASIVQEREFVIRDLESLIGTTEILTGNQPSGVDTFGQTQILAEQALRRFNPQVQRWKRGLAAHERRKLLIIKNTYTLERLVNIVGENEESELRTFKGADIGNTRDVVIDMAGGVVVSDAFEKQKIFQILPTGLLNLQDPHIANKVLDILEVPGFVNQFSLDAKRARRLLKGIREKSLTVGDPFNLDPDTVTARGNDNHQIYFQIYSDFTKTAEFDDLEPEIQEQIGFLMSQHQQALEAAKMQAVAAVQNTRGSGPQSEGALANIDAVSASGQAQELAPTG
tara:strand:+ start:4138 stop:6315 length:2178 start_codon:yes stop_codon:yes gene_type:complete